MSVFLIEHRVNGFRSEFQDLCHPGVPGQLLAFDSEGAAIEYIAATPSFHTWIGASGRRHSYHPIEYAPLDESHALGGHGWEALENEWKAAFRTIVHAVEE